MLCVRYSVDLLRFRLDHDVAVDEDGADDGEGEHWVREDVYGDAADGCTPDIRTEKWVNFTLYFSIFVVQKLPFTT